MAQSPVPCQQFEVGSDKWVDCVERAAQGGFVTPSPVGGGVQPLPQGSPPVCTEFEVGTPQWERCVEDAVAAPGKEAGRVFLVAFAPMVIALVVMTLVLVTRPFRRRRRAGGYSASQLSGYTGNWLMFVGLIELVSAGGFLAGYLMDRTYSGFLLTAAILGGVGVLLFVFGIGSRGKAAAVSRIEQTGLTGEARVVSMTQTGVYINENPQVELELEVSVAGRNRYQVFHKEIIPLILLGRLGMAATLPVKVDPEDPERLVILWDQVGQPSAQFGGVAAPPGGWQAGQTWPVTGQPVAGGTMPVVTTSPGASLTAPPPGVSPAAFVNGADPNIAAFRQFLETSGDQGYAIIETAQDMGTPVGSDRLFQMGMAVSVGGRPRYKVAGPALIPAAAAGKAVAGRSVPVRVHPQNLNAVLVEWDRA